MVIERSKVVNINEIYNFISCQIVVFLKVYLKNT